MREIETRKKMLVIIQISNIGESIQNRAMRPLGKKDEPEVLFLIRRLKKADINNIVIATTKDCRDDGFEKVAEIGKVGLHRGDFYDIVNRFISVCKEQDATNFVKVNGNYPFVDIESMIDLYKNHVNGGYDYSYNEHLKGILWGMGCEVYNTDFINLISKEKLSDSQKQTIGLYIRQAKKYHVFEHQIYDNKRPSYKLSLESERDYEVIREVSLNVSSIDAKSVASYLFTHPITAKYNLESRPKETGLEKMFLNLEKADSIITSKTPDLSYPISVEMTLTNACNMGCVYCSDAMLRKRQGNQERITLEEFERLFRDLAAGGTKGIVIEGGGEPTLYSRFNEVVNCAVSNGLAVGLITNGSKRIDESVLEKFEWIRVSLDASTPEEYRQLKGVDYYERVIDNISFYAKHCPTVGVGYVVTMQNISEIEALVLRLRELKVSYIQLRPVVDNEELYPKDVDLSYLKFYMTGDFGIQVDGMKENAETGNHGLPCYASSITSIISGDGSVYICGRLNIYDWLKPIGNITKESFHDIWYGDERQRQIDIINDAEFCKRNCPQCRISKFNVLFDKIHSIKTVHFI